MSMGIPELILGMIMPIVIIYFVVKFAVKNAIQEMKKDGSLNS